MDVPGDFGSVLIGIVIAAVLQNLGFLWGWLSAYVKSTPQQWDDRVLELATQIADRIKQEADKGRDAAAGPGFGRGAGADVPAAKGRSKP